MKKYGLVIFLLLTTLVIAAFLAPIAIRQNGSEIKAVADPNTVPVFLQGSSPWGSKFIPGTGKTMASIGCAVTCSAMLSRYYGVDTDPGRLLDALGTNGFSGGNLIWERVVAVSGGKLASFERRDYRDTAADMTRINQIIDAGHLLILEVRAWQTDSLSAQHFVLVTGRSGSNYTINDPISGRATLERYNWWGELSRSIFGYRYFLPAAAAAPVTTPATMSTSSPNPGPRQVILFEHAGYTGKYTLLEIGQYSSPSQLQFANDSLSSFKLGADINLLLAENDNFTGRTEQFTASVPSLVGSYIGNDQASSAKVYLRSATSPTAVPSPSATTSKSTIASTTAPTTRSTTTQTAARTLTDSESRQLIIQSYLESFFQQPSEQQIQSWLSNKSWLTLSDLNRAHQIYIQTHTIPGFNEAAARESFVRLFVSILNYVPSQFDTSWNVLQLRLGTMTLQSIEAAIRAGLPKPSPAPVVTTTATTVSLSAEQRRAIIISSYHKVLYRNPSEVELGNWEKDHAWSTEAQLVNYHMAYVVAHTIPGWDEAAMKAAIIKAFVDVTGREPSAWDLGFNLVHVQIGVLTLNRIYELLRS